MSQRVIAIGDIHGCATALGTLIDAIGPEADDTIVPLGDCVDRGPDSREVIEQLLALREQCRLVPLLGNHEEMMLNYLSARPQPDDWLECGGAETLASYGSQGTAGELLAQHAAYIETWQDYYENEADEFFFVHGSYEPDRPLAAQRWNLLRWYSLRNGLPEPHVSGRRAIVGHTSQKNGEILDAGYLVCIDTYCYGGGWLTALDATSGQIWQANDQGQLRG